METKSHRLITTLKSYQKYGNNEYYIRKNIGKQYGVKRATNKQLEAEVGMLETSVFNKLPEDITTDILLKLQYNDIVEFCNTHTTSAKICKDQKFWQKLVLRDFPHVVPNNVNFNKNARQLYITLTHFFDKYTNEIIAGLITYKHGYLNLGEVYQDVFELLIEWFDKLFAIDFDKDDDDYLQIQLDLDTFPTLLQIFNISTTQPIDESMLKIQNYDVVGKPRNSDRDKYAFISFVFQNMFDEYIAHKEF